MSFLSRSFSRAFLYPASIYSTGLFTLGLLVSTSSLGNQAQAAISEQQTLVNKATLTIETIFSPQASDNAGAKKLLQQARAVMICPSLVNVSLIFGGSGGRCLLLSRDARGSWSDPAFYHLTGGSFGIQLGYQDSQLLLFIMSQKGIQALLDHQFTFDGNASASFANMSSTAQGRSASGAGRDIYVLQRSSGLFAGASLGGSKLSSDSNANRAYYQQLVGPEDIIIHMRVNNTAADPLRRALMAAAPVTASSTPAAPTIAPSKNK